MSETSTPAVFPGSGDPTATERDQLVRWKAFHDAYRSAARAVDDLVATLPDATREPVERLARHLRDTADRVKHHAAAAPVGGVAASVDQERSAIARFLLLWGDTPASQLAPCVLAAAHHEHVFRPDDRDREHLRKEIAALEHELERLRRFLAANQAHDTSGAPLYRCDSCGAHGCKLWRSSETIRTPQLACCDCAAGARVDVTQIDENGLHGDPPTDQIGRFVPAVPIGDGRFWGYGSVPLTAREWWRRLPTRSLRTVLGGLGEVAERARRVREAGQPLPQEEARDEEARDVDEYDEDPARSGAAILRRLDELELD